MLSDCKWLAAFSEQIIIDKKMIALIQRLMNNGEMK